MAKKNQTPIPKPETIYYVWVVAYIESEFIHKVERELRKYPEYNNIEAYIPTVRVLKKTFKGKQEFDEVPLLFNYGFFKVPRQFAVHSNFLDEMRANISCIYSWVKDPFKAPARSKKQILKEGNERVQFEKRTDSDINYATATDSEITYLLKNSFQYSAHDADELNKVKKGSVITLRGYPFEGIEAILVDLNFKKREAIVKIRMFDTMKDIPVSFDNVFFTMYKRSNFDENISTTESLDNMDANGTLDKTFFKTQGNGKD